MPGREQTIAGKPVRVIRDISSDLPGILPIFDEYTCIVLISRYNTGKTTSATDIIFDHLGKDKTEYITLTEQRKENKDAYRESTIRFSDIPEDKTIVFDELHSDQDIPDNDMEQYLQELLDKNKVIILTNPYGTSGDAEKETRLFLSEEEISLPENTLIVFVTNKLL